MVLAYAILLLIVLAVVMRRDLSGVGKITYRGGPTVVTMIAGLFLLQAAAILYVPGQAVAQMVVLNLSQIVLVLLLLFNHHIPGVKLFVLGIILNIIVMAANGGWMPVTPETYHFVHPDRLVELEARPPNSKNIVLPRSETHLWILSDVIPLALPDRNTAVSPGDVIMIAGVAYFIFQATRREKPASGPSSAAWS